MSMQTGGNLDGGAFEVSGRESYPTSVPETPFPPRPVAPPIVPGMLAKPPHVPVWPTPIGIIAIVFGAGGVLASLYSAAVPWLFSSMSAWTPRTPGTTMEFDPFASVRNWAVSTTVVHGLGVLVAAMLLAGGIGLLRRRPWSVPLSLWWAVIRIPMALAVTAVTVGQQQEQMAMMSRQAGGMFIAAFTGGFVWLAAIMSIAWYCAFPVFMIIWLLRPGVRADVRTWRADSHRAVDAMHPAR